MSLDQASREPLQGLQEDVLHGSEVVMDQTQIDSGLASQPPGRDARVPHLDEEPFGSVEQPFSRVDPLRRLGHLVALPGLVVSWTVVQDERLTHPNRPVKGVFAESGR